MEASFLEEVAASLVREFLSKKCLKKTIVVMDEELPRTALSINNRNELRNVLHLQSLCKQNKARENPLKTLLEVMASYFLERTSGSRGVKGSPPAPRKKLTQPRCTEDSVLKNYLSDEDTHLQTGPEKSKIETSYSYEIDGEIIPKRDLHRKSEKCKAGTAFESSSPSEGEKPASHHYEDMRTPELSLNAMREQPQARRGGLFGRGTMAAPPVNSPEDSLKRRRTKQPSGIRRTVQPGEENGTGDCFAAPMGDSQEWAGISRPPANLFSPHLGCPIDVTKDYSSTTLTGPYANAGGEAAKNSAKSIEGPFAKLMSERRPVEERKPSPLYPAEINKGSNRLNFLPRQMGADRERTARSTQKSEPKNTEFRKMPVSSPSRDSLSQETLELVDVEDEENLEDVYMIPDSSALYAVQVTSKPIDYYLARDLKILLFGSSLGCFSEEWKIQSFMFNDIPQLKYGIVQKKGGPCGVLAVVQAFLLRHLIFGDSSRNSDTRECLQVSAAARTRGLTLAIASILWRGGGGRKATIALCTGTQQFTPAGKYKADGILEMLMLHVATSYEDLLRFLQQNIHQFEAGPYGCILLTLSAILSRSIDQVRGDFDVITNRLIGAHGYCTQELVNLLLTGQAVSNVFNDVMELDSGNGNITLLKGVSGRSDVGVLSLFEHYNICQVGCYLKTPKFPIWVVCSESHFSVLFCLRKDLLADWKTERRFDLYYYDGLANQQDEIRLTVDTSQTYIEGKDNDLTPPLEHCIRTKWKGAVVDWNGTEPIL